MYSEEYLLHFLIENVPMWTKVMTTLIHLEERQSNVSVESWFNLVKNHILAGKKRMKCGRFIENITQYEAQCFRQVELQIPRRICAIKKKMIVMRTRRLPGFGALRLQPWTSH
ncbi:unnamed protein product [Macrosiphum euphorbiae]|nr:unnamed protein product [Macrosiphum euphorbiae]